MEKRKKNNTEAFFKRIIQETITPPPDLTVSEWADQFRRLSSESSSEPGQWNTDRAPYQRAILDSVTDPEYEKIIIMSSAQVGKSELLLNTVGYHVDFDPAPILLMQPTVDLAKNFSKERLAPMFRDSPTLRKKVSDEKSRDSGNTVLQKTFPGGFVALVGANAPSGLASRPIKILLADEVDRFPDSAGKEGDPLTLAEKRTNNFPNRKKLIVSTPTNKGASRIEKEFENSTKEYWNLPCPSCGEYQPLVFNQIDFETESMRCKHCGYLHNEFEWKITTKGKWIATNPGAKSRGFHLNELVSPWRKWSEIIQSFQEANRNGPEALKVFVNTSLGESWEPRGEGVESEELLKRREDYGCEVPKDVVVLTAGVDVQDNRLEYEIVGWSEGKSSWGIKYGVIMGDPGQKFVWEMLDQVIFKEYTREDGQALSIMTTCVDSGGHHTETVYSYCKEREYQRVWAIKGSGNSGKSFISRPTKKNKSKAYLFTIGVDVGKDTMMSRLSVTETDQPGYCHFPSDSEAGYDREYFKGLTSEHRVIRQIGGQPAVKWEKKFSGIRNEPWDLRNYATAALEILNPVLDVLKEPLQAQQKKTAQKKVVKSKKRRRVLSKGI